MSSGLDVFQNILSNHLLDLAAKVFNGIYSRVKLQQNDFVQIGIAYITYKLISPLDVNVYLKLISLRFNITSHKLTMITKLLLKDLKWFLFFGCHCECNLCGIKFYATIIDTENNFFPICPVCQTYMVKISNPNMLPVWNPIEQCLKCPLCESESVAYMEIDYRQKDLARLVCSSCLEKLDYRKFEIGDNTTGRDILAREIDELIPRVVSEISNLYKIDKTISNLSLNLIQIDTKMIYYETLYRVLAGIEVAKRLLNQANIESYRDYIRKPGKQFDRLNWIKVFLEERNLVIYKDSVSVCHHCGHKNFFIGCNEITRCPNCWQSIVLHYAGKV